MHDMHINLQYQNFKAMHEHCFFYPYSIPHLLQSPPISPTHKQSSRPTSFLYEESMGATGDYAGELFGRPSGASFEQLLTAKLTNQVVPGIPHSSSRPGSTSEFLTPEALLQLRREAKKSVGASFGLKIKKRYIYICIIAIIATRTLHAA